MSHPSRAPFAPQRAAFRAHFLQHPGFPLADLLPADALAELAPPAGRRACPAFTPLATLTVALEPRRSCQAAIAALATGAGLLPTCGTLLSFERYAAPPTGPT